MGYTTCHHASLSFTPADQSATAKASSKTNASRALPQNETTALVAVGTNTYRNGDAIVQDRLPAAKNHDQRRGRTGPELEVQSSMKMGTRLAICMRQLWSRNQKSASSVVPGEGEDSCHALPVSSEDAKVRNKTAPSVMGLNCRSLLVPMLNVEGCRYFSLHVYIGCGCDRRRSA
jgi:hypothetical protein